MSGDSGAIAGGVEPSHGSFNDSTDNLRHGSFNDSTDNLKDQIKIKIKIHAECRSKSVKDSCRV